MKTKIFSVSNKTETEIDPILREAGQLIREGGIVAFPTETVYGLGGDAFNKESAEKIYCAKGRPSDNPLIIHIARFEDLSKVVDKVTVEAQKITERFWPGPLTIILPKAKEVPYATTGGLETVAIRMPSHEIARKFITYSGGFVAAPSANTSGKPSPTVAKYVKEDMDGKIEGIVDGGLVGIGIESTIIDLTQMPPQILRPGFVTQEMLEEVLGEISLDKTLFDESSPECIPRAPGMKYRHYAPNGILTILEGDSDKVVSYINVEANKKIKAGKKVGIIATLEQKKEYKQGIVKCVGSRLDEEEIARSLYRILREFDDENVEYIFSESFYGVGIGDAIMNRLLKAAGHKIIKID